MDRFEFEAVARYSKKVHYFPEQDWHRVTLIGGSTIYLPAEDQSLTPHIVEDGYWESWISAWFVNQLTEGGYKNFIDIGANSGYFSVVADPYVERVVMVEANPSFESVLKMTAFGMSSETTVVMNAVWDKNDERLSLRIPGRNVGSSTVVDSVGLEGYDIQEVSVSTVTADSILGSEGLVGKTIVKIDAESAEERVWDGMSEMLDVLRPVLFIEFTPGAYSEQFVYKLASYGSLRKIGFDGYEYLVSPSELESSSDWCMLVVRPL